ncbi:hypothetical protein Daus18300_003668 [Diaporthe australafricana]|uniref:SMP domain-containing protein n=1 Tax=Diaporthe australafricana TaxID=127596 RepID=A0ABR3XF89_9PEZI
MPDKQPMSSSDASRIQSTQARSGGDMSSGGFAARAQSGAANNTNSGGRQNQGSQGSTGGAGAGDKK